MHRRDPPLRARTCGEFGTCGHELYLIPTGAGKGRLVYCSTHLPVSVSDGVPGLPVRLAQGRDRTCAFCEEEIAGAHSPGFVFPGRISPRGLLPPCCVDPATGEQGLCGGPHAATAPQCCTDPSTGVQVPCRGLHTAPFLEWCRDARTGDPIVCRTCFDAADHSISRPPPCRGLRDPRSHSHCVVFGAPSGYLGARVRCTDVSDPPLVLGARGPTTMEWSALVFDGQTQGDFVREIFEPTLVHNERVRDDIVANLARALLPPQNE